MAEQTFRSPGFFDQEIDISEVKVAASGIPAGIVGTAEKGPAFVPVTVGSFDDFQTKFGGLDSRRFGPYAVEQWFRNRSALTYVRVLGAGTNKTSTDIATTRDSGAVKNAGFRIVGAASDDTSKPGNQGYVQLIVARHNALDNDETNGFPIFTDNGSISNASAMNLVRGVVLMATGTRLMAMDHSGSYSNLESDSLSAATVGAIDGSPLSKTKYFKLMISSSSGKGWSYDESQDGLKILTASLDPNDSNYISRILNTDPAKFQEEEHLLYLDFAVNHDLAPVVSTTTPTVAIVSGSAATTSDSIAFLNLFGRYDTRYTTPRTTSFISQPFGEAELDLFYFETLTDGAYANEKFKISIAGVRASTNEKQPFGSFEVQVRAFNDGDTNTAILERYPDCSLDPTSDRYIARMIGDKKVAFDWDQESASERRLVISGKYPNVSQRVRIVMNEQVELGQVPEKSLPFGFRGIPVLKTTDSLTDSTTALTGLNGETFGAGEGRRLGLYQKKSTVLATTSSIVPPLPYRVKCTRGAVKASSPSYLGESGESERIDTRYYWGVKTDPLPVSSSNGTSNVTNAVLKSNEGAGIDSLVRAYTKFQGILKMDTLVTGAATDFFNDNKFTLSRVALHNAASQLSDVTTQVTSSAAEHMLEAAYVRNGRPDPSTYTVTDGSLANRITMASLIATSSALFNRFTDFNKFTNIFYGGFDGVNILDEDQAFFKDRALSTDTGGKAVTGSPNIGLSLVSAKNQSGEGRVNNNISSLRAAISIITEPTTSKINLLAIPGIREPFVTDFASDSVKMYGLAAYIMDIVEYDKSSNRLYDDSTARSDVTKTISRFETRGIDNNYVAVYFPDVIIDDVQNNHRVQVAPSIAALGAIGFNDKTNQVWFAPAGFNRGALEFVTNVENRLSATDRDDLYDAKINPIATFPRAGFVIFGQKTLQVAQTALNRINARRMLIDVKRRINDIARRLVFEQNNVETRASFVAQAVQELTFVQAHQGIEKFNVVCDSSNNPESQIELNRLKGRVQVVPTRAIEFISVDFIITNSGVSFE